MVTPAFATESQDVTSVDIGGHSSAEVGMIVG